MMRVLKWILGLAAATGIAVLLGWAFVAGRAEMKSESEGERPIKAPSRVSRDADGMPIVTLDAEATALLALRAEPVKAEKRSPEVAAYGALEEDPSGSFVLRAPIAGTLRLSPDSHWPALGEKLAEQTLVALVDPRLAPVDRANLEERLASARAEREASNATLSAAQASQRRLRTLNAEGKNVSDRAVQEAEALVRGEQAKLNAASQTIQMLERLLIDRGHMESPSSETWRAGPPALRPHTDNPGAPISKGGGTESPGARSNPDSAPTGALPLILARGGEIVETSAQPGETVESGQAILRAVRFDRLVARVHLPAGEWLETPPAQALLQVAGGEQVQMTGALIGPAAAPATFSAGQTWLFSVDNEKSLLRPGTPVAAYLPASGAPHEGVIVPRAAIIRFNGQPWVYVEEAPDRFKRRTVTLDKATPEGWFCESGLKGGERVVTAGGEALLSEELKSQITVGEEEEKQ